MKFGENENDGLNLPSKRNVLKRATLRIRKSLEKKRRKEGIKTLKNILVFEYFFLDYDLC